MEEELLKIKKIVKELEDVRGRHTELVTVYIPAGANLQETINMLRQEYSLAQNVKDKTVRKNVMAALDKIIYHLQFYKVTPKNGLAVFCGNVSKKEGVSDIRLWSIEPPEKLTTKIYRCDQVFILEPLKEMLTEKDVFGLIVLDANEATIGLLRGKAITVVKKLESTVPAKTVKGGMCVSEDTLIQLEDGNIIPIKDLTNNKKILSYSFEKFEPVFTDSFEIFKKKVKKSYKLIFEEPSTTLTLTPEHLVFVISKNGIEEKAVEKINVGDMLLFLHTVCPKCKDDSTISSVLSQLLGYFLGGGTIDGNRVIFYNKDLQLLDVYKKLAEKVSGKKTVIYKKGGSYELRLYKKSFVDFLLTNFPKISKPRREKDIDEKILHLPKNKLKHFIRGLFDAKGYVDQAGIVLRMTNENIMKKLQLLLTRFGIASSLSGPDKFDRYELRITNVLYISKFKKEIGFSSQKKATKLNMVIKKYKSGFATRVPISGIRKLIENAGLKKEDLNKYIEKIYGSNLIALKVKEKIKLTTNSEFYDLFVPKFNCFVANGILVHNSQKRYDRLREDALNEFFTKVGETASQIFLQQPELKGIIIGGPGPTKESFASSAYLHHEIQKKVLGIKDVGYTDEYGLSELVKRSSDLIEKATVVKERELVEKFLTELQKEGNVVYGLNETLQALEQGAVDTLLISEAMDLAEIEKLMEKAKSYGTRVELISTDTPEGVQFKELGGIGGFLRYKA